MSDFNPDILGYVAATLSSFSLLPQAIQTIKTRNTLGISLVTYVIFFINIILWFTYGVLKGQMPIIVSNILPFFLTSTILYIKISNILAGKKRKKRKRLKKLREKAIKRNI